jgi:hypothetical protein
MSAQLRETVNEGPMTAAVVWFQSKDIHTAILRLRPDKSSACLRQIGFYDD